MAIFDSKIIDIEGGYTDDPDDLGGPTKYGISQKYHPNLDIKNLTVDQALAIYKAEYWDANNLGYLHNQNTANLIFRLIVNIGKHAAIELVQQSVNDMHIHLQVDGIIGPVTIKYLNIVNNEWLQSTIRIAECNHYLNIVDSNPTQNKFFKGWIRRALM